MPLAENQADEHSAQAGQSKAAPARAVNRGLWIVMAAALVLGLIYNAVILPGYGPDEPRHLR